MLIGLHGQAGSGKDTVFERAIKVSAAGRDLQRISFAGAIKRSVAALFDISVEEINNIKNEAWLELYIPDRGNDDSGATLVTAQSFRQFLQRYGTEAHRELFGDNFWLNIALPLDMNHGNRVVFVTDVRFENEADRITNLGGEIWHVIGPDDNPDPTHDSEKMLPARYIDVTIDNRERGDNFNSLDRKIHRLLSPLKNQAWEV